MMTHITPLPATISRETAVAFLHKHEEMISLNPLVIRHTRTSAPPNAAPDETEGMVWYEITDEIQYIPGTPLKGEVSYKAGFYDLPTGLQTHTFAPAGVDIQGKWTVGGNAPGEKREPIEIGIQKPSDGLYLREEVDLKCNILMSNFVKRNLKKSHATLVDNLVKKAQSMQDSPSQTAASNADHKSKFESAEHRNMPAPTYLEESRPTSRTSRESAPQVQQRYSSQSASRRDSPDPLARVSSWATTPKDSYDHETTRQSRSQARQNPRYVAYSDAATSQPEASKLTNTTHYQPYKSDEQSLSAAPGYTPFNVNDKLKANVTSRSEPRLVRHSGNSVAMELDGNPVAAQHRAAELE